jgi:hypothetical protein
MSFDASSVNPQPTILAYFLILFPRLLLHLGKKLTEGGSDIETQYEFLVALNLASFPSPDAHSPVLGIKSCGF